MVSNVSELLGLDSFQLSEVLTQRSMILRGEEICSPLTVEQVMTHPTGITHRTIPLPLFLGFFKGLRCLFFPPVNHTEDICLLPLVLTPSSVLVTHTQRFSKHSPPHAYPDPLRDSQPFPAFCLPDSWHNTAIMIVIWVKSTIEPNDWGWSESLLPTKTSVQ